MTTEAGAVRLVPLAGTPALALPRLPAAIGSDEDADVLVAGTAPRHAVLFERDGEILLVDSGSATFEPRFVRLRAFFPHQGEALPMTPERVSEAADLALMRVALEGRRIPILPLETERARAVAGQPVVVVGYPTGLEAILAKAETGVVKAILDSHGTDSDRVTDALSRKGLIRPSTTQGHIGDITATDIVFDAPSAQGGSGGPVFNKHGQVIAVEYAVLPKFGGNSFGVPVAYALELLRSKGSPAR